MLVVHVMACIWIFVGQESVRENLNLNGDSPVFHSWINSNSNFNFNQYSTFQLYTASLYYTVTTITTVGYGDISGTNTTERFICMLNMLIGVVFFGMMSSYLTSILLEDNRDQVK